MRCIALIYDARSEYDRQVIAGVAAYYRNLNNIGPSGETLLSLMPSLSVGTNLHADGMITNMDNREIAKAASRTGIPLVGYGTGTQQALDSEVPFLFANNKVIGQMAAEHLFGQGFRCFAYVASSASQIQPNWDTEREQAFRAGVAERRADCRFFFQPESSELPLCAQTSMAEWLRRLPKPIGIMAANDERAYEILESCRLCGIDVPHQVAVLGVDNNQLLCHLSWPALTSIDRAGIQIGFEAAKILDQLMARGRIQGGLSISPRQIVVRQSTNTSAPTDPGVETALEFIRMHHQKSIRTQDVVGAVGISECALENRFSKTLGRSISSAIRTARLEHARSLIEVTKLPLKQIAPESGFGSVQHMTTLFRRAYGRSPARYRKSVEAGEHVPSPAVLGSENANGTRDAAPDLWPEWATDLASQVGAISFPIGSSNEIRRSQSI